MDRVGRVPGLDLGLDTDVWPAFTRPGAILVSWMSNLSLLALLDALVALAWQACPRG